MNLLLASIRRYVSRVSIEHDAKQAGDDADLAHMLVRMGQDEVHQTLAFGPAQIIGKQLVSM